MRIVGEWSAHADLSEYLMPVVDMFSAMRWPLIALMLALLYQLSVRFGGGQSSPPCTAIC